MKTVTLEGLGPVPAVGLGMMRLPGCEDPASFIREAIEAGLHFFDHADIYGGGGSETIFGKAAKGLPRESYILQSKCGIRDGYYDLSKEHILASADAILRRLNTDYLDVLLLHRPDALMEPEEVAEAFDALHGAGKVRRFGVSNMN
ncbi:MAG: aldo/keto reductase, partial [Oscillospiraceae bacterium]|nr:aldo/keto reductase [Oscillospiraceae bacterium]